MIHSNRTTREKTLAIITGITILAVAIYTMLVEPQIIRRSARLEQLAQAHLTFAKMNADVLIKDRIDNIYRRLEPLIVASGEDQQEISLLTRELQRMYDKRNLKIRSVKIMPTTKEPFYRRLAIKLEMVGEVGDILGFIRVLESHPRPIKIERLDLIAKQIAGRIQTSFIVTKVVTESGGDSN